MTDLRLIALQNLQRVVEKKGDVFQNNESQSDDSAFVMMLTMTALRKMVYIKSILKTLITKKLTKQNIVGQCALILGAVELLYMNTPDYAVINSYVNLVKEKTDKYIAGFVNAVLRKIAKQKDIFISSDTGVFFPQEFKSLLKSSYSAKEILEIEKSSQNIPFLDITYTNEQFVEKLGGNIILSGTVRVEAKGKISSLPDYEAGTWWVQDFASSLPIKLIGDINGKNVLELCAAPGGKTAQLISKGAKVTCLDISESRLEILKENMNRLRMYPEKIICADGLEYLNNTNQKYDIVVIDAPCTATGTLRRHPEIVHIKTKKDVLALVKVQRDFLNKADNVLSEGGLLLYCTCSLCKEEGEYQIEDFLKKNKKYSIVNFKDKINDNFDYLVSKNGLLRILPHHMNRYGGADGFFAACLRKER